ncbi:nucleoside deaminase [Desulfopila sp. IMCC35006]|uniref:nucleoside deaminase n=1 Tax=Desulfopila sp. IMCC35006 TaxID=2569542 RepID=UPI0010ABD16E|nr:nucleoside deaminase [Desulfopila sp. IMCC35006]TKB23281.1 nucleoside deaminase [Desulfopila sp. IMCC35006]
MRTKDDIFYLREANEVAIQARAAGNTPFGAILVGPDGEILLRQGNVEITEHDCTGHAETTLARKAFTKYTRDFLWQCSLYSTFEPCAMCCGAIYWANIGRVVYGTTEKKLLELTGDDKQNPTFDLPCRDIFDKGQKDIQVEGPFPEFETESVAPHRGYWNKSC